MELLELPRPGELLAAGTISVTAGPPVPLEHAADALTCLRQGTNGRALVLQPGLTAAAGPPGSQVEH